MKTLAILGLSLLFILSACDKKETADKSPPAAPGAPKAAPAAKAGGGMDWAEGFDASAELAKLEGTWQVRDSLSAKSTWEIKGSKLIRKAGDKVEEGEIEMPYPGKVAFVQKKGGGTERSFFSYTRNGEDVYIGLGKAGMKIGERWVAAVDGLLVLQGQTCKYFKKKMFEGFEDGVDVKCEIKEEGEKKALAYEIPDSFKQGEMYQGTLHVVGDALLDDQMMKNKVEKGAAK